MSTNPIYVDNTLFLGRVEEQKQFRAILKEVLDAPRDEELPYIVLIFGDGGMGKTTLAKRFQNIAKMEQTFEGRFQILWMDWEDERRRYPALQVGREHIGPEAVFDVIHSKAVSQNWGRYFSVYQDAVKKRSEVEKKAVEALSASSERDDLAAVRGVSASAIAKVLRVSLPIGDTGEQLAKMFLDVGIKVGAEQAAQIRSALENRLRARLDLKQFDFFLNPNEQLARALAEGLEKIASNKPLIVFLDTYEIVDRADLWMRVVMRTTGPRVAWVISGRDNLVKSGQFGAEYFKGYAEDFQRRLLVYNMLQLAEQDILALFADRAHNRELDQEAVQAISRATRGVPLALDEAAEMWAKGIDIRDIVGDIDEAAPRGQIVQKMTARYLLHAVAETDKLTIFALALARGNTEILRSMLRPADKDRFDLDTLLRRLERDYASVLYKASEEYETPRLHDEPALFIREYLKEEVQRKEDYVKILNRRAVEALHVRLNKLEADLPRLEDRCEDDDWVKATLDLLEHLFWLDESEAWHCFVPRLVDSLSYSRQLLRGLLQVANNWDDWLSKGGKKRLKVLRVADDLYPSLEENTDLLNELTRFEGLGWFKGDDERERSAILSWKRGKLLYQQKKYTEALAQYERAEGALPENGEKLRKQLGEALHELAQQLIWPDGRKSAVYSPEAESILSKVVEWLPDNSGALHKLGVTLRMSGKETKAVAMLKRAIEITPSDLYLHHTLGNTYRDLGRFDDALASYNRVMEINDKFTATHNSLGHFYRILGKYDEAMVAYQRVIELDPADADPHYGLGNMYRALGNYDDAVAAYQRAITVDNKHALAHNSLGSIYDMQGQYEYALKEYREAVELDSLSFVNYGSLISVLRKLGHESEAEEYIQIARKLMVGENEYNKACFHAICGNIDNALELLKMALEKKQTSLEWARHDPDLDFIRNDPRFITLVENNDF